MDNFNNFGMANSIQWQKLDSKNKTKKKKQEKMTQKSTATTKNRNRINTQIF